MSRRKAVSDVTLTFSRGVVLIDSSRFSALIRSPNYFLSLNQKVLLPGLRRDCRRVIYVNGKRRGTADYRLGCIPLEQYRVPVEYWSDNLTNLVRETFGLGCPSHARGYYNVRLWGETYIVLVRRTTQGYYRCIVHRRSTEEYLGDFLLDPKLESVYPRMVTSRVERQFYILIGYIMDNLVYSRVVSQLERSVTIDS